jgi:hypothetical protein
MEMSLAILFQGVLPSNLFNPICIVTFFRMVNAFAQLLTAEIRLQTMMSAVTMMFACNAVEHTRFGHGLIGSG